MTIAIQRCGACGAANYPRRSLCRMCLSDELGDLGEAGGATLLAATTLHRSLEAIYQDNLPFRIGTVQLDLGPSVLAIIADDSAPGDAVRLEQGRNMAGDEAWIARRAP